MAMWQLKRNDTKQVIELPEDLYWADEFGWSCIAQSPPVYMLSGAMSIQQGIKKAGRPITLTGDWVWLKRSGLLTLQSWTDVAELTMTLTHYDERTFEVIWRLHDKGITASPVEYTTPEPSDADYIATIRLMTI